MPLIDYYNHRGIVLDVDLAAPPGERWKEAAECIAPEVNQLVLDVVTWCRNGLPREWPPWLRLVAEAAVRGAADFAGRSVGFAAGLLGQEYAREVRCIAKAADVSYPQLVLANVMYDIAEIWHWLYPSACSSYSCSLPSGEPILCRTLDWGVPEGLGKYTVLVVYHRGKRQYVSVGLIGFVGVLSAMRPGAWAVALNQAPSRKIPFRAIQIPACVRLRSICDVAQKYGTIVERMKKAQRVSPFFVHIIGTERQEQTVIRSLGGRFRQRKLDDSFIIQTNHFVSEDSEDLNDLSKSYHHSRARYRALRRRLRYRLPDTVDKAQRKLKRWPVNNERTIQIVSFCPATGDVRVKYRP